MCSYKDIPEQVFKYIPQKSVWWTSSKEETQWAKSISKTGQRGFNPHANWFDIEYQRNDHIMYKII